MTLICASSHFSVNACLAPICSLHHVAVTTVEGIGNTQKLHPVQVSGAVSAKLEHFPAWPCLAKSAALLWVVGRGFTT